MRHRGTSTRPACACLCMSKMAKAELTTVEAASVREHHSLVSCGSICCVFSCVLDDVLSIIHTVFLSRYSRFKTSSWGAGPPNQHVIRRWLAAAGRLSTTHPAVTASHYKRNPR